MKQCRLRRGHAEATAWIEDRGAKVGKRVEILPSRDVWDVVEVYPVSLSADVLRETQRLNRGSLPSVERMA